MFVALSGRTPRRKFLSTRSARRSRPHTEDHPVSNRCGALPYMAVGAIEVIGIILLLCFRKLPSWWRSCIESVLY
jgi:hypothetical protein